MTADAVMVFEMLFGTIWTLFTSWEIPGTHMSPAEWAFFVLGTVLIVKILKRLLLDKYDDDDFGGKGGFGGSGLMPRL